MGALLLPLVAQAIAPASVWVIDDGEKIRQDAISTPFESGEDNPVWQPGQPARLFAMRGESVALQVVVEAGDASLDAVTVDLPELDGEGGAAIGDSGFAPVEAVRGVGRPIERFVEHFVHVKRASGGRTPGESLGWEAGAGPTSGAWVGPVPDALVPVELAPAWLPYPMRVRRRENGIVWIDVNVPKGQRPGMYHGEIRVRDGERTLSVIEVRLSVVDLRLPDRPGAAVAYYDPEELSRRVGSGAEEDTWKVLRAHRVTPLHDAMEPEDVRRQLDALTGALYTPAHGYAGPAEGVGDAVLTLGAYGALGDPSPESMAKVRAIAQAVAGARLFGRTEVMLYADDESCSSPRGAAWRAMLRGSSDPDVRRIRVAWTCSERPLSQPVDIAMVIASAFNPAFVSEARARGQEVWVYNGVLPRSGTFLLDADAVSPRVNGLLGAMFGIPRWFYWETTHWYRDHGKTPVDPFDDPESLRNADGDYANGDGVLLYPGRQRDGFGKHSLGFDGVIPSIRLKNWRRGLEDAGYLELARARTPALGDAVVRSLIPAAFVDARPGGRATFSPRGRAFFDARRALLAIALDRAGSHEDARRPAPVLPVAPGRTWTEPAATAAGGFAVASLLGAFAVMRARRRRRG
ncbi:MAG: glycoside hydrolase domain-containing protein [Polyangiaceae bacterium]